LRAHKRSAKPASKLAPNAPLPSFDPDEDRREEFRDLSFLTLRRKC